MVRTDEPSNMNIVHDDVVLVGQSQFIINTGLAGSLAALSLDGELLASGYANQFGAITLNLEGATDIPGVFDLVITGFNAITYESEITVLAPEGPYVTMDAFTGEVMHGMQNELSIDIENVGSDPADELVITLSTNDEYVIMVDDTETVSLDSGESMTVNGFSADISSNIPNGHQIEFSVNLVSGNDAWDYSFVSTAMAPEINLLSFSGDLQPGTTTSVVITMINEGSAGIMYPMLDLEVGPYLSVSNIQFSGSDYYWDMINDNNIEQLTADISVSASAPMGSLGELTVMIDQLNSDYHHEINIDVPIGQVTADFESGLDLEWNNGSFSPWNITDEDANTGLHSFKSGTIGNSQTSSVSVTLDVTQEGDIEFYYRVSAEYSPSGNYFYDGLLFSINGQQVGEFQTESDGSSPWKVARYTVSPGETEFTWTYIKDSGGGSTDCINTD